jgi:thiol-disulfide isomerase/thioredoxin
MAEPKAEGVATLDRPNSDRAGSSRNQSGSGNLLMFAGLAALGFAFLPRLMGEGGKGAMAGQAAPDFHAQIVMNESGLKRATDPAPSAAPTSDGKSVNNEGNIGPLSPSKLRELNEGRGNAGKLSEGKSHEFALSELRGKAVVVDFWATWCGPCRAEAPIINALAEKHASDNVVFIGLNTDDEEGNAVAFARKHGLTYPIAYDADRSAARAYNVKGLPTLVVISRSGKVVGTRTGVTSAKELDEMIREALE